MSAAAERVREFLTAQTAEDAESGKPTPELAWSSGDGSGLKTLYTADLRELVNELDGAAQEGLGLA